jgi:hypothetical protein
MTRILVTISHGCLAARQLRWLLRYVGHMSADHVFTAAEVERLSPNGRAQLVNDSVVIDLTQLDPEFLTRIRSRGQALLQARGEISSDL